MSFSNNCKELAQGMHSLSSGILRKEAIFYKKKDESEWKTRKPDTSDGYHNINKMNFDAYDYASESFLYKHDLTTLKNNTLEIFHKIIEYKREIERLDKIFTKFHHFEIVADFNAEFIDFLELEKDGTQQTLTDAIDVEVENNVETTETTDENIENTEQETN